MPLPLTLAAALVLTGTASAPASDAGCAEGVAVVVDFTDVGGRVEVGCAAGDPGSGRAALEQAGFTPTDSIPGMICAIDSLPDPCPEEFEGSFWSYWTTADGQWVSHSEGADTVDPAPGDIEGWRYNDGASGPGLSSAEVAAQATRQVAEEPTAAEARAGGDDADDDASAVTADDGAADAGGVPWWLLAGGVVLVAVLGRALLSRRT